MIELKEFEMPVVKDITSETMSQNYAIWFHHNRVGCKSGLCIGESLESTIEKLILFCDSFASTGQVITVRTNFDKNQFLDAIRVKRPHILFLLFCENNVVL